MKPQLPYPEDPKAFTLWLDKQDAIADKQIALGQERSYADYLAKKKETYV